MVGVLLKKQLYERLSYFKRNRKNIDVMGITLTVLLVALVMFVVVVVFKQFIEKYTTIRINNVLDVKARLYEIMTIIYEAILIVSILGSTTALTHSIFESDDRNVLIVLPVKPQAIFIAKMITVYFSQALLSVCVTLPLVIVFAQATAQSISFIIISTVASLLIPFVSLGVASMLCLPYFFIKKFIQSKYVLFLVTVTAIAGILFVGYSELLGFFEELISRGDIKFFFSEEIMNTIISVTDNLVPANFLAKIVFDIEPVKNALILVAIIIGVGAMGFFVEYLLYNAAVKIRVQSNDGIFFHAKGLSKPRSISVGLVIKELGAIVFTPDYAFQYVSVAAILPIMVYCCMGLGEKMLVSILHVNMNLEIAVLLTVLFGSLTNTFCATNISREGRSFYMQKTLPISCRRIITVKILLNFVITILSVGISTIVITANQFITVGEGFFVFFVGITLGLSQICFATRIDLNKPFFPNEEDNTIKEGNGNVSTIILLGMFTAIILGGLPLFVGILGIYKKTPGTDFLGSLIAIENFTYLFAGILAIVVLIASVAFTLIGLRSRFERLSEGD